MGKFNEILLVYTYQRFVDILLIIDFKLYFGHFHQQLNHVNEYLLRTQIFNNTVYGYEPFQQTENIFVLREEK